MRQYNSYSDITPKYVNDIDVLIVIFKKWPRLHMLIVLAMTFSHTHYVQENVILL